MWPKKAFLYFRKTFNLFFIIYQWKRYFKSNFNLKQALMQNLGTPFRRWCMPISEDCILTELSNNFYLVNNWWTMNKRVDSVSVNKLSCNNCWDHNWIWILNLQSGVLTLLINKYLPTLQEEKIEEQIYFIVWYITNITVNIKPVRKINGLIILFLMVVYGWTTEGHVQIKCP